MNLKVFLIYFMFVLATPAKSICQVDTSFIFSKMKMYLFEEVEDQMLTKEQMDSFYSQSLIVRKLESRGFKNLVFYHIPIQELSSIKFENNSYKQIWLPAFNSYKYYVIAWNPESYTLYRISGFNNNDIKKIINNKESFIEESTNCFFNIKKKKSYDCLWIEGVSFSDLLKQIY